MGRPSFMAMGPPLTPVVISLLTLIKRHCKPLDLGFPVLPRPGPAMIMPAPRHAPPPAPSAHRRPPPPLRPRAALAARPPEPPPLPADTRVHRLRTAPPCRLRRFRRATGDRSAVLPATVPPCCLRARAYACSRRPLDSCPDGSCSCPDGFPAHPRTRSRTDPGKSRLQNCRQITKVRPGLCLRPVPAVPWGRGHAGPPRGTVSGASGELARPARPVTPALRLAPAGSTAM